MTDICRCACIFGFGMQLGFVTAKLAVQVLGLAGTLRPWPKDGFCFVCFLSCISLRSILCMELLLLHCRSAAHPTPLHCCLGMEMWFQSKG